MRSSKGVSEKINFSKRGIKGKIKFRCIPVQHSFNSRESGFEFCSCLNFHILFYYIINWKYPSWIFLFYQEYQEYRVLESIQYICEDARLWVGNCMAATCFSQEKSDWKTRTLEYQVVIAISQISTVVLIMLQWIRNDDSKCLQLRLIFLHPWTKGIKSQRRINSAMEKDGKSL